MNSTLQPPLTESVQSMPTHLPARPNPTARISKVKMEIKEQKDLEFAAYVANHLRMMQGNPNFEDIQPPGEVMENALDTYKAALEDCELLQSLMRAATIRKRQARKTLEKLMVRRGASVQCCSAGHPAKIQSAGLGVKRKSTPVGPLPPPMNFRSSLVDRGDMLLRWEGVEHAIQYVIQWSANEFPRQFTHQRTASQTKLRLRDLPLYTQWVFRIATMGTAGLSPWSAEMICGVA